MAKKKDSDHYVNNAEFSQAVVDYVRAANEAEAAGEEIPVVPDYIAECFMKIAEGLSHRDNFSRYSFRSEMVMDGVENCLRAIKNYNVDAATRSGKPNAFSYFTTITYYAFLRRIQREKKQQDIKMKYISQSGLDGEQGVHFDRPDQVQESTVSNYVGTLKSRIDASKTSDSVSDASAYYQPIKRNMNKSPKLADSNLEEYMNDE